MFRILFRLLGIGLGLSLITAAQAFPAPPADKPTVSEITRLLFQVKQELLTKNSFIKDIARKKAKPAEYLLQFKEAKNIYNQLLQQPRGTPFDRAQREALQVKLGRLTVVGEQTRQLWQGVLTYRNSREAREDMVEYLQDYFGFDTSNDISLLPTEVDNAFLESPLLQQLQEFYRDFAERFTQFVKSHNRLPQTLGGIDIDAEEIPLSQEYQLFLFMNPYHRFEPLEQYIQQIEEAAKSVK